MAVAGRRGTVRRPARVSDAAVVLEEQIGVEVLLVRDKIGEHVDLAGLLEDDGRELVKARAVVDGNARGVISTVLQAAQAVQELVHDGLLLGRHAVVHVGKDPAHLLPSFIPRQDDQPPCARCVPTRGSFTPKDDADFHFCRDEVRIRAETFSRAFTVSLPMDRFTLTCPNVRHQGTRLSRKFVDAGRNDDGSRRAANFCV